MDLDIQGRQRHRVWLWSPRSEAHVCSERSMFKEYTKFTSEITTTIENGFGKATVFGVGTVDLFVKTSSDDSDSDSYNTLSLTNVLHVPDIDYNILTRTPDTFDWKPATKQGERGCIINRERRPVAYFFPRGKNYAVEVFNPDTRLRIFVSMPQRLNRYQRIISWAKTERDRWASHGHVVKREATDFTERSNERRDGKRIRVGTSQEEQNPFIGEPERNTEAGPSQEAQNSLIDEPYRNNELPYTPAEQLFLKMIFGTEDKFLEIYGLNPLEAEHRRDGRSVARALILERLKEYKPEEETQNGQGSGQPTYSDPQCVFSAKEVDFINERWGNTVRFMQALRLDMGDRGNWQKARWFVRSLDA